jgi:hypothetical protein
MMKAQQLLDPAFVGWIGARSQSPYFARGFVLVQELDDHHSAAQELLGQFARLNWSQPIDKFRRSVIYELTVAAYY